MALALAAGVGAATAGPRTLVILTGHSRSSKVGNGALGLKVILSSFRMSQKLAFSSYFTHIQLFSLKKRGGDRKI